MRYLCFNLLQLFESFQEWFVAHLTRLVISLFCSVVAFATFLEPTYMLILVCFFAIIADCYTAWRLAVRLRRKYPLHPNIGKFQSKKSKKVVDSMIQSLIVVILAYLIDEVIIIGVNLYLQYYAAGAVGIYNFISVLENISSESDANWAKFLQKFLINKAERHIGFSLDELKTNLATSGITGPEKIPSEFSGNLSKGEAELSHKGTLEEDSRVKSGISDVGKPKEPSQDESEHRYSGPLRGMSADEFNRQYLGSMQNPDPLKVDVTGETIYQDKEKGVSPIVTLPAEAAIQVSDIMSSPKNDNK